MYSFVGHLRLTIATTDFLIHQWFSRVFRLFNQFCTKFFIITEETYAHLRSEASNQINTDWLMFFRLSDTR